MKSENKYIGDDKFEKFLNHYSCPASVDIVKMRFTGAICSPNMELRPADVIASLWEDGKTPRLETKNEADLFFKFFMGLWDEMFSDVSNLKIELPKIKKDDNFALICEQRYSLVEEGFVEGFWGGKQDVKIPAYIAEIIDNLTSLAEAYKSIASKANMSQNAENMFSAILSCDKLVVKSISFVAENYFLPRMDEAKRVVN